LGSLLSRLPPTICKTAGRASRTVATGTKRKSPKHKNRRQGKTRRKRSNSFRPPVLAWLADSVLLAQAGAWAFLARDESTRRVWTACGTESDTSTNAMSLRAAVEVLGAMQPGTSIRIWAGNGYLIDTLNGGHLRKWRQAGWQDRPHLAMWQRLHRLLTQRSVRWSKPQGFHYYTYRRRVKDLARNARESASNSDSEDG